MIKFDIKRLGRFERTGRPITGDRAGHFNAQANPVGDTCMSASTLQCGCLSTKSMRTENPCCRPFEDCCGQVCIYRTKGGAGDDGEWPLPKGSRLQKCMHRTRDPSHQTPTLEAPNLWKGGKGYPNRAVRTDHSPRLCRHRSKRRRSARLDTTLQSAPATLRANCETTHQPVTSERNKPWGGIARAKSCLWDARFT